MLKAVIFRTRCVAAATLLFNRTLKATADRGRLATYVATIHLCFLSHLVEVDVRFS